MGKTWDGTDILWKYLWSGDTFVRNVAKFLKKMRVEKNILEQNIAHKSVDTQEPLRTEIKNSNAKSALRKIQLINPQTRDSVPLLVLTGQELLELLKGLSLSHTFQEDVFLNGDISNAYYVIPVLLPETESTNTVTKSVVTNIKKLCLHKQEIPLTSMDVVRIKNVIGDRTGIELEERYIKETDIHVNTAKDRISVDLFSVITLSLTKSQEIIHLLTLLLYVLAVTVKSKNIQSYLASNFMECVMAEVLRVLKPGAHGFVWALPRTSHWTATALEDAGFEIRDIITHCFGSGFPKSLNIGKKIKEYNGWGTALKPASEHWILVRKPCSEKTVAQNILKWRCGGINVDKSRISINDKVFGGVKMSSSGHTLGNFGKYVSGNYKIYNQGRFPANLVLSHNEDCEKECTPGCAVAELDRQSGNVLSAGKYKDPNYQSIPGSFGGGKTKERNKYGGESGGASRFFKTFECTPGCAVAELDNCANDSSMLTQKLCGFEISENGEKIIAHTGMNITANIAGPSRFFYCSKPSKQEKNAGCEDLPEKESGIKNGSGRGFSKTDPYKKILNGNNHPTVKSVKLMKYLINMITPPVGILLDPFGGSGTTLIAAEQAGLKSILIEKEQEYYDIILARANSLVPVQLTL